MPRSLGCKGDDRAPEIHKALSGLRRGDVGQQIKTGQLGFRYVRLPAMRLGDQRGARPRGARAERDGRARSE
jgi:hypothetical protein